MATRKITMPLLMTELSYLLGEVEVPSTGVDGRKTFLQRALEDAWKLYPWPFSLTDTTLTFTNGVAELPEDFLPEGHYYLLKDGREIYSSAWAEQDRNSDYTTYLSFNNGSYFLNLTLQNVPASELDFTFDFRYQYTVPDLSTSDTRSAYYTNPRTIALGAMRDNVKADNPEVDNSQEIATFIASAQEDYSAFNRINMRNKRARGAAENSGHSTGVY